MDIEEFKRLIKRRIARLRKQLEFYENLLKVLDECGSTIASLLEEIRDEEGRVVARVYKGGNTLRMVLEKPANPESPYIRFISRRVAKMREEGVDMDLSFEYDSEGRVVAVVIKGILDSDEILENVLRALRFTALHLARST